jgi:hypothetical protein
MSREAALPERTGIESTACRAADVSHGESRRIGKMMSENESTIAGYATVETVVQACFDEADCDIGKAAGLVRKYVPGEAADKVIAAIRKKLM